MALRILSSVNEIFRRDVEVDQSILVDPNNAACLVSGEWVALDANGKADIDARANTVPGCYQVFSEKGDYSAQALNRVTILSSLDYIAETDQYSNATTTITAGAFLKVNVDGVLVAHGVTTGDVCVAIALNTPTGTDDLRFQRISPMQHN